MFFPHGTGDKACALYIKGLKEAGKLISAQPLIREGTMLSGTPGIWKQAPFAKAPDVIVGYYHIQTGFVYPEAKR